MIKVQPGSRKRGVYVVGCGIRKEKAEEGKMSELERRTEWKRTYGPGPSAFEEMTPAAKARGFSGGKSEMRKKRGQRSQ